MQQNLYLVTPATEAALTLAEVKNDLRVLHSAEDAVLDDYIAAAQEHVEKLLDRALVTSTWDLVLQSFPFCSEIVLPKGQLTAVTSVTYLREGETEPETLPGSAYQVIPGDRGLIALKAGAVWPAGVMDQVVFRFVAGWPTGAGVPAPIKQAMRLMVRDAYEHSSDVGVAAAGFASLLVNWRLIR